MIQSLINEEKVDAPVPFGSAVIEVKNGMWTFNGKQVRNSNFVLKSLVSRFILGCKMAYPIEDSRTPTERCSHLKRFNHRFKKVEERELPVPIEILPQFVKKETSIFPEFVKKH